MNADYTQIMNRSNDQIRKVIRHHIDFPPFINNDIIIPNIGDKETQTKNITDLIQHEKFDILIPTDGSTLKESSLSYGKSGSSAIIYENNFSANPIILKESIGNDCNNYIAEINANILGLSYIVDNEIKDKNILFLGDCCPASSTVFNNNLASDYNFHNIKAKKLLKQVIDRNNTVKSIYVPAHNNFQPNELADLNAKRAAELSNETMQPQIRKLQSNMIKEKVLKINWNKRYNESIQNPTIHEFLHNVENWIIHNINHNMIPHYNRLISGHNRLNSHQHTMGLIESPDCEACNEPETVHHYIYHCERYTRFRHNLFNQICIIDPESNHTSLKDINMQTLIGQRYDLNKDKNQKLLKSFLDYIKETNRFK